MFSTGPALRFRPEPATHQRAVRARRGASGERSSRVGPVSCLTDWRTPRAARRPRSGEFVDRVEFGTDRSGSARRLAPLSYPVPGRSRPRSASQGMAKPHAKINLAVRGRCATPIPPAQAIRNRLVIGRVGAQTRSALGTTRICRRNRAYAPTRFASEGFNGSRFSRPHDPLARVASLATLAA